MGDSQDDLKAGLQPFIVVDGFKEFRCSNLELASIYGGFAWQQSSHHVCQLASPQSKRGQVSSSNYFELEKSLGMFGNLLDVALGSHHPLTVTFIAFWDLLTRGLCTDLQTTGHIKPAHVLSSVQVQCYTLLNHRCAWLTPPTPYVTDILHNIMLQSYVLPHLPLPLFKLAYPQTSPPTPKTLWSNHTVVGGTTVMTTTTGNTMAVWGNVSVLTNPTLLSCATSPKACSKQTLPLTAPFRP